MNETEREEIRRRADAATPGPWSVFVTDDCMSMTCIGVSTHGEPDYEERSDDTNGHEKVVALTLMQAPRLVDHESNLWEENAEFIAHARTDVPALLDALDSQDAELSRLRALCATLTAAVRAQEAVRAGDDGPVLALRDAADNAHAEAMRMIEELGL